jgi:hypothetical protein
MPIPCMRVAWRSEAEPTKGETPHFATDEVDTGERWDVVLPCIWDSKYILVRHGYEERGWKGHLRKLRKERDVITQTWNVFTVAYTTLLR